MVNDALIAKNVLRGIDPSGNVLNVHVDASGNLLTTGSGSSSSSLVQVGDGTTPTQKLAVDSSGRITIASIASMVAAALADTLANPTVPSLGALNSVYNGATWDRQRTPLVFTTFSAKAIGTEQTIWTPTSGKKFRIMGGWVFTDATVTVSIKDGTGGSTILLWRSPTTVHILLPTLGNGILSAAANNLLTATGSGAANFSGTVFGTEE